MPGFETLLPRPVSVEPLPGHCPVPSEVDVRGDELLPAEGYRLEIDPSGVTLYAADAAGEFYGRQTLRQLIGPDAFRAASIHSGQQTIPCGVVTDHPRFGWRGCLLDVARNFRTKAEVLRFVDLIAAHKLNVLNLHLTDDQGWRIEIPEFPRLTEVGGWRKSSMVGRHDGPERDGRPHGGFYSADDLREIVAYAAARAVTVVPEVDIPGHARAAIAAYPELGPETAEPWEVWTSWGISTSLLNTEKSTVDLFKRVFDHVLEIFPSEVIALGGDEVPGATEEHGRFVREIAQHLVERGRRPLGWDEVLEAGDLPPMVIGSWQSEAAGARAATAGHDVVMCPEEHVYLDHRQSDHPDEPIPVGYLSTLESFYGYEPVPADFPEGKSILGAQAQVWSEHLDTVRRVDYVAFPRLCAFAEVAWSDPDGRDYAEFLPRLRDHHLPRLDALGVEYRPLDGPHPWQTRPGVPGRPRQR
ncbi:beta-N-acetylhexosaminidase [Amycolatopsis sp. WAC 04182]|uniref:beta-N-acetylhexosaminidase n=1 Tax=Amycolatopsis sp. WAC 04182 TaxID=2203198 RepID=UPI000F7B67D3|nr:beta-N-acetylhexosaminidase [Amycolatopsis sp. WAC 04182]RSN55453.1 beta-N-acetylhexosaminidase [Amycolatopsis sp. WAC 04182]